MRLSVLIPTFRRPVDLRRCLNALSNQTHPADQTIVIIRPDDVLSAEILADFPLVTVASVLVPGVIAAMNAGLAVATGDIVALTDDDAAPWPDWLERIRQHFVIDPKLGGLGGRDWQYKGDPLALDNGQATRPGELQWWGRVIGQHHWAVPGPPREVSVIKGVNCAYRAAALRDAGGFDTRLCGTGAQVHWELSLGLSLRRSGWKVVFDPELGVDHFPAVRFDEDQRGRFVAVALENAVANETFILLQHFGRLRRSVFLTWAMLLGTSASPGLMQLLRFLVKHHPNAMRRFAATARGRYQGIQMYWRARS